MADKRLISAIGQFQTDQLQDGHITADFRKSVEREMITQCSGSAYNVQAFDTLNFNVCQIYRNTVENTSNLGPEAAAESKAESKKLKNEGNILMKQEKHLEELTNYIKAIQLDELNDQNAAYYYTRAASHVELGNHASAIKDCHTALSIDPSHSIAYARLGFILWKQKKHHEALANYTKAIQLDDQNAAYYCNRAAIHVELGNHALAIKDCHTALSIDPLHINVYDRLGYILMIQKKHHEALDNYTKAIQLDDHNVARYCNRAVAHFKFGNYALAITDCQAALSINPLCSEAYNLLGNILVGQKEHHEALANCTKAIELDDHNAIYYCNRAFVHIMLGNDALAIKDCHTALSIDPSQSKAYARLGVILRKQEKHHEALANYTKAIQLDDHNATYYCNRAVIQEELGIDTLAIEDCHTALSIDPSNSNAYAQLGHILMKQEKHHEALANYTKAIQLDDHNTAYYCNRVAIHLELGNDDLATKDCHTALSIDPSCSNAYARLGLILRKQEKYHEALANYTKAIQLDDRNVAYYCNRAVVHYKLGNRALTMKDYETALSIDPSCRETHNYLDNIRVLIDQKEYHEALANYTKLIQLDSVVAYPYRAVDRTKHGNSVLAIKDSLTALSIDPSNSEAYSRLGLAFCNLGVRLRKHTKRL